MFKPHQRLSTLLALRFPLLQYRPLLMAIFFMGGSITNLNLAKAASPAPGNIIENQATGSFIDTSDNSNQTVFSDVVQVTVAEVTGITITPSNTPTAVNGSIANFDFIITNTGNDPTKFYLPTAPSSLVGGTAGTLQISG